MLQGQVILGTRARPRKPNRTWMAFDLESGAIDLRKKISNHSIEVIVEIGDGVLGGEHG